MTTKITELPPDEWERVATAREQALTTALTAGVTREEFTAAAAVCYAAINQPPPVVLVAPSPLIALAWSAMLRKGQLYDQLYAHLGGQLDDQLHDQLYGQLGGQLDDQLYGQLYGQLHDQLYGQLHDQLHDQLGGQLDGQLHGQLRGQLDGQLYGQLGGQLYGQLHDQLGGQLHDQLHDQLGDQLHDQLGGQLDGQLGGQLYGQLDDQLDDQLCGQLGDQLYGQLGGQLYGQLGGQLGGVHWSGWRQAWLAHWLHLNTLPGITPVSAELVTTMTAYRTFCVPAFTIPLVGVVIGLGPHLQCEFDPNRRLHNPDSPAWSWPTGEAVWAWHGTRVPEWVITDPTVDKIAAESNTETRRCAIENLGWATYLDHLQVAAVSVEPDPGNPGFDLALYDVPDARTLFGDDVRVLVMHNASRDRDGTRRTFAETVPATCRTATEAAAWQFDVEPDIYRALVRST